MTALESHINAIAESKLDRDFGIPVDYFSWARDPRHVIADTEAMPTEPRRKRWLRRAIRDWRARLRNKSDVDVLLGGFHDHYTEFESTYQLMSDQYSRELFAELIVMKLVGEERLRLSSFSQDFIASYEQASADVLASDDALEVYGRVLKKIELDDPAVRFYTVPTILNLHLTGRLYSYCQDGVEIAVEPGDVLLDAGVGWGDTPVYLASRTGAAPGGHVYCFDILREGLDALAEQRRLNPELDNITPVLCALADTDGEFVHISAPGPGATVVDNETGTRVETLSIDNFARREGLDKIDFIKMDIEGAEVPALRGAADVIRRHKPRLAISVYHKWDDLLVIPRLIAELRDDYNYYLDCTTGFGGEVVLYCR